MLAAAVARLPRISRGLSAPLYQRALAIVEKALCPEHPRVATLLENYALLLRTMGRSQKAKPLESRARAIRAKNGLIRNPGGEPGRLCPWVSQDSHRASAGGFL